MHKHILSPKFSLFVKRITKIQVSSQKPAYTWKQGNMLLGNSQFYQCISSEGLEVFNGWKSAENVLHDRKKLIKLTRSSFCKQPERKHRLCQVVNKIKHLLKIIHKNGQYIQFHFTNRIIIESLMWAGRMFLLLFAEFTV